MKPVRVALIGCGNRARDYYAKLLRLLPGFDVVGCVSRRTESAAPLAEQLTAPVFRDLDELARAARFDFAVLSVPYHQNGAVGLELVERGISYLGETPIAHQLADGDVIVHRARERGLVVGVAEQFPSFPIEALKRSAIESGLFGTILHAASDFAGHGYHGMALVRGLIGLGVRPVQALGIQRSFAVAPHWSRIEGRAGRDRERWDFGTVEFANGAFASFLFTDHGYDSPLRWHREVRFFGSRGMGVNDRLAVLDPDRREPLPLPIQWETDEISGQTVARALSVAVSAHLGGGRVEWRNPFPGIALRDDEIAVAQCLHDMAEAVTNGTPLRHDATQGVLDQECTLAIERSHERGGAPCPFPLQR